MRLLRLRPLPAVAASLVWYLLSLAVCWGLVVQAASSARAQTPQTAPTAQSAQSAQSAQAAPQPGAAHETPSHARARRVVHREVRKPLRRPDTRRVVRRRVEPRVVHRVVRRRPEHRVVLRRTRKEPIHRGLARHAPARRPLPRHAVVRHAVLRHPVEHHPLEHRPLEHHPVVRRPVLRRPALRHAVLRRPLPRGPAAAWHADPISLASGSALVIDARTHQVLLSKDAGDVRPIASLTKLMTAAVVLDAHLPMQQRIAITDADIDTLKWSSSRLRPGMVFSREELLKLALMSSENRAAHALARSYPGGVAAFVQAMNRKAAALGMAHTHYVDPTGLSPQNESTAEDLSRLAIAAYAYPLIREFSTHPKSTVVAGREQLQYRNTDHLIFNRGWDILLQKTGFINEAGHCLVLNTVVQGRNVIVVLLDAWGRYAHFADAEHIRDWMLTSGRTLLTRVDPIPGPGGDATSRAVEE